MTLKKGTAKQHSSRVTRLTESKNKTSWNRLIGFQITKSKIKKSGKKKQKPPEISRSKKVPKNAWERKNRQHASPAIFWQSHKHLRIKERKTKARNISESTPTWCLFLFFAQNIVSSTKQKKLRYLAVHAARMHNKTNSFFHKIFQTNVQESKLLTSSKRPTQMGREN